MFRVIVKDPKGKLVANKKFNAEAAAWKFFEQWDTEKFWLEFKDMSPFQH
jgi:hypothetical protein